MQLKITHRTEYRFEEPVSYALRRLRLVPQSGAAQKVRSWTLSIEGATEEVRFVDHYGNDTRLISILGDPKIVSVEAAGDIETINKAGVSGSHQGFAPLWLFEQQTPLTAPGEEIKALAAGVGDGDRIACLHRLMAAIHERVSGAEGAAHADGGAEQAFAQATGASQDHAQIFISAARLLGFPARYVSGYLMVDGMAEQATSYAWGEAHVAGLGWVGFDVANDMSPDENYVRIAIGRDHRDAMPVSGFRLGQGEERLAVSIALEQ